MASKKSISKAMESIDGKKEDLRKAFDDLQSHSSSLSSFTLQWKDLEDHFDSIRKSIDDRLKELDSKEKKSPNGVLASDSGEKKGKTEKTACVLHPQLKTLCSKMDAVGLRTYITENRKDLPGIREELGIAFRSASDSGKLVLDALVGYYPVKSEGNHDSELGSLRRTCVLLLEELAKFSPKITQQVKERAKKLSVEWKKKVGNKPGIENALEIIGFLQLVATYGLTSSFDANEILDLVVGVSKRKQTVDLLKGLGIKDKIPDFIEKLTSKEMFLEAVKFVYAFELVEKFPPVPLLKLYQKQSKKVAQEMRNKGNSSVQSLNQSIAKEIAAVKSIIKCVEEHGLESQYPKDVLVKRIEQLEKQKAEKKRPASGQASAGKNEQQQSNKRPRPAANISSSFASIAQPHLQSGGSTFADRVNPYMNSSSQYGQLLGTAPSVAPYLSSASGSYGLGASSLGYGGGRSPPRSYMYPSGSHLPTGLYDRPTGLGGFGAPPPSHRPSYYP